MKQKKERRDYYMDDNSIPDTVETTETKQSTKTFSQSEHDKAIAEALNKEKSKYSDYEQKNEELSLLKDQLKKIQEAEMTELEKVKAQLTEANQKATELTQANLEYAKKTTKQSVLNDAKYSNLPRAYKNMILASDNSEDVVKSAEEVLEEYNKDTNQTVKGTFGVDKGIDSKPVEVRNPSDLKQGLRANIEAMIKNKAAALQR